MKSNITIFNNPQFGQIRTMTDENGNPWFCGKDVARALGYGEGKSLNNAVAAHVDEEDKGVTEMMTPGGKQKVTFINESGLYSLVLSSKLDTARQFKRWVTSEVLPAIRKHGAYTLQGHSQTPMTDEEIVRRAFAILNVQVKTLTDDNEHLTRQVERLTPMADYCERCLQSSSCLTTTQVAKSIGMTGPELYARLQSLGVLYRQSGQYMPYAKYARMGLTSTRTKDIRLSTGDVSTKQYLVWTERGARFLREMFLSQTVIPGFGFQVYPVV